MDIYQVLHREHEEVSQLFQQIEGLSHGASRTRSRLFGELKAALEHHSRAEEKVFYPELRNYDPSHFLALEAAEEHHVLDLLLKELARMDSDKEEWLAKLSVLKEEVLHHVDQEENELFPKAREFIDASMANDMAIRFEEQKKRLH